MALVVGPLARGISSLTIGDEAPPSRYSPEKLSNQRSTDWISRRAREM